MADEIRRFPALQKNVSGINEKDVRVSVLGMIIDRQNGFIIVDDGTGKIKVSVQGIDIGQKQMIRVFGRVIPTPEGCELQGEIVQDMSKADLGLFKKLEALNRNREGI